VSNDIGWFVVSPGGNALAGPFETEAKGKHAAQMGAVPGDIKVSVKYGETEGWTFKALDPKQGSGAAEAGRGQSAKDVKETLTFKQFLMQEAKAKQLMVPYPYGAGKLSSVKKGEMLVDTDGNEHEFLGVADDGKHVCVSRGGKTREMSPSVFSGKISEAVRTIKNDAIKGRGAPEEKARAFDKVNKKTGHRPSRSVLKKMAASGAQFYALEKSHEKDYYAVHVMRIADAETDQDYYGVNVLFMNDGSVDYAVGDDKSEKQWKNHKAEIIKIAKAGMKDPSVPDAYDGLSDLMSEASDGDRMAKQNPEKIIKAKAALAKARKEMNADPECPKCKATFDKAKKALAALTA
jgi:hypothetical protein